MQRYISLKISVKKSQQQLLWLPEVAITVGAKNKLTIKIKTLKLKAEEFNIHRGI